MPRPKISEQNRQRIAKACLYCQSSKVKCDGLRPCGQCIKRQRSSECDYSSHLRSYGRQRRRRQNSPVNRSTGRIQFDSSSQRIPVGKDAKDDFSETHVAISNLPRNLCDTNQRSRM
jgi:hypothetical protein